MSGIPAYFGNSDFSYRCPNCRLEDLVRRPQMDFEIDFFERILDRDPNFVEVLTQLGQLFTEKGLYRRALNVDQRLSELRPRDPVAAYNLACSHALLHHTENAIVFLRRAVQLGFDDYRQLVTDPDLASLRLTAEFVQFVRELQQPAAQQVS